MRNLWISHKNKNCIYAQCSNCTFMELKLHKMLEIIFWISPL